jgi:hypothetical protein
MTVFKSAINYLLSVIILVYAQIAVARVNCDNIIYQIERGRIQEAAYLIDDGKAPQLCYFHLAWALKDQNPTQARGYIERIKNILDKREPFYYKALYLKLLLLDELSETDEARRAFNQLSLVEADLAKGLKSEKVKQFRKQLQKLRNAPFHDNDCH